VSSDAGIRRLMFADSLTPLLSTTLSMAELKQAQDDCRNVKVTTEAQEAMMDIRRSLQGDGILVGDRRARKTVHALKCFAWLNGDNDPLSGDEAVTTESLELLSHIWWSDPAEQPHVVADAVMKI